MPTVRSHRLTIGKRPKEGSNPIQIKGLLEFGKVLGVNLKQWVFNEDWGRGDFDPRRSPCWRVGGKT